MVVLCMVCIGATIVSAVDSPDLSPDGHYLCFLKAALEWRMEED